MSTRRGAKRYHVRRRVFLNRDMAMPAYVIGIVEDTRAFSDDDPGRPWEWADLSLDLGDCNRRVSFDFQMSTRDERAASLYKIRRLAEVINAVRDAIELEAASLDGRPRAKQTDDGCR